jgi:hypothetical protein
MISWPQATKAVRKIANPTPAMIDASRRGLERNRRTRHAEKGDYWSRHAVYVSLTKAILMTFALETSDHSKYYGFAGEVYKLMKSRLSDDLKQRAITDAGTRWVARGANKFALAKIVEWAIACFALDKPEIRPDPREELAA